MNKKVIEQEIKEIAEPWKGKEGNLIMILHQIQNRYKYVPREVSLVLSEVLDVPLARIYEVITFYHFFRLSPPGKRTISVCMGTACQIRGAQRLLDVAKSRLGINPGETTTDRQFTLNRVNCLGCCAIGPVMVADENYHGRVDSRRIEKVLDQLAAD